MRACTLANTSRAPTECGLLYANHRYIPNPVRAAAVVVMAARRLPMPNMLLLRRITASCALS